MSAVTRYKSQKYILLMLLFFAGQTVAMPFLDCCVDTENTSSDTQEITSHHDHNDKGMSDNHSDMNINKHEHADEANCNHQCEVCLGTVVVGEHAAFATQIVHVQLNKLYSFILPTSSTDNPFRPPIFA